MIGAVPAAKILPQDALAGHAELLHHALCGGVFSDAPGLDPVEARPVEADLQDDMYVVTRGLKAGDIVISEGLSRVRPGQTVQVQLQDFEVPVVQERTAPVADEVKMDQLEQAISDAEAPDAQSLPQTAQSAVSAAK